jgi:hypothetical protein
MLVEIVGADPCVGPGIATIFQNRANIAFGGTSTWVCPYGYAKTVFTAPARFLLFQPECPAPADWPEIKKPTRWFNTL